MKHLLLLFICTVSLTVWGQETVPYTQTFDGPGLPSGWTTVDNNAALNDPDQVWTVGTLPFDDYIWTPIPDLDGNFAYFNSASYGATDQDVDLISPLFNFTGNGSVFLRFKHFYNHYEGSTATLYYKIGASDWEIIQTWTSSSSNPEIFNQLIPAVANQADVQFKWNFIGNDGWGWSIDNVSVTSGSVVTWTGDAASTEWNNANNWNTDEIPISSSTVIIPDTDYDPVISSDVDIYSLDIADGANVTLNPTYKLTIYSNLNIEANNGLIIKSDATGTGSLITGAYSGAGTVNVELFLSKDGDGWSDISSPLNQSIENFLSANTNVPTNGLFRGMTDYDTEVDKWNSFFTNSTTGPLTPAKGFLLRTDGVDQSVQFSGTINTGAQNIDIFATGNSWNFIGNPYTSAISINNEAGSVNFLTYNESSLLDPNYVAVYVWDGNQYDIISLASIGAEYATIGQGFFIKAKETTYAAFTPDMQIHQPVQSIKSKVVVPEVKISVANGKKNFSTRVYFQKDRTLGLDKGYDAGVLKADKNFSIYTRLVEDNNIDFGIQSLPFPKSETMVIPVGIDYKQGGDVTISLNATNLLSDYNLVLEDRLLNKFIPFNEASNFYNATLAAETKGIGRFYLHVKSAQTTGIDNLTDAKINAWIDRDEIVVKGVTENNAVAKLFDARGSLILMKNLENTNTNRIKVNGINTGIYMLQVIENGKRTATKLQISGK